MKFIADFHIHSHYSIATSKDLTPEYLDYWARLKGISILGTGDFTYPGWLEEMKEKLEPAEQGLFKLRDKLKKNIAIEAPSFAHKKVRFILTSEISNIYKKYGKVRKVHNLIFAPDFQTVEKMQTELSRIGNITSDGRPILGIDSRDLLEIALNSSDRVLFVPAHIWTPWFSALGSQSGFESIEECYGDLADYIFAVETGLSSNPPMNWICSFLDRYTLISNSDAHSPEKLGREANIFNTELSYDAIILAIKSGNPENFLGTVEFFPQEGKYHYDGHRKCGIRWDPLETLKHNGVCPVCGKNVTIGVVNRVLQLADRKEMTERKKRHPFYSLIPLKEILSEITGVGPQSKKVLQAYNSIVQKVDSEFDLLLEKPIDEVEKAYNDLLSEAIRRMREGEVYIEEGFDGEYGRIRVFKEGEKNSFGLQESLFKDTAHEKAPQKAKTGLFSFDLLEYKKLEKQKAHSHTSYNTLTNLFKELNSEQKRAMEHLSGPALVLAGPGTGKTQILTTRIANLILNRAINPESILAVTFTNKAASEMKERLKLLLNGEALISRLQISTFHAFGLSILKNFYERLGRSRNFSIIDEDDRKEILYKNMGCEKRRLKNISDIITKSKQNLNTKDKYLEDNYIQELFNRYEMLLIKQNLFDLDDLIYSPIKLFTLYPKILSHYRERLGWILIDEYQDINYAQYQMIKMLSPHAHPNLYVIGDPNQAIYGFRGADVRFIRRFIDDYPGAVVYRLKKSYRCTDFILRGSGQIIKGESLKDKAIMLEGLRKGIKIKISRHSSDKSEAEFVARTIEKMMGGLRFFSIDSQITEGDQDTEIESLSDFVVLCRMGRQMEVLKKAFNDHVIPYQIVTESPFFETEPIKSIVDLLKLSLNPENTFLKNRLIEKNILSHIGLREFHSLIKNQSSLKKKVLFIIDKYFSTEKSTYKSSFERLLALTEDILDSPEEFLQFAATGTGIDTYKPNVENVTLMTIHAAKGLEFTCVFIVGCENGLLPYSIFEDQRSDFDEERRLLYVGMTRAKRFLFLSHAEKRYIFGKEYHLQRSPYLDSIEEGLIELSKTDYKKVEEKEDIQPSLF